MIQTLYAPYCCRCKKASLGDRAAEIIQLESEIPNSSHQLESAAGVSFIANTPKSSDRLFGIQTLTTHPTLDPVTEKVPEISRLGHK